MPIFDSYGYFGIDIVTDTEANSVFDADADADAGTLNADVVSNKELCKLFSSPHRRRRCCWL